jgi:hypothetical protein
MSNDVSPKSYPKHFDLIFLWLIIDIIILKTETTNETILIMLSILQKHIFFKKYVAIKYL